MAGRLVMPDGLTPAQWVAQLYDAFPADDVEIVQWRQDLLATNYRNSGLLSQAELGVLMDNIRAHRVREIRGDFNGGRAPVLAILVALLADTRWADFIARRNP